METDFEWTSYCYNHLKHDLKINPPAFKRIIDSCLIKGYSTAYYVQSKTDPVITYLRGQWYPKKKKEIPLSMLEKHFTEETLAWWYMDDGHLNIKNDIQKKII